MKNIFYHTIGILFACLWFTSCEQEIIYENTELGEGVTLSLRLSSNNLQSRAEAGDNTYNENAITKVDLYLYPEGGSGQAKRKITANFSSTSTANLTASLSSTEKEALFGSGTGAEKKCHAYALVNYNGTAPAANTEASTIAALKALEITPNSPLVEGKSTFATCPQTSFVMDGESDNITYNGTNQVTGTILVDRAASKISLFVTGVDKTVIDDAGNTWIPNYEDMDITFYNGVNKSKVDGGYLNSRPVNTLAADNIYETSGIRNINIVAAVTETTETVYKLDTTHEPFYSYSYDWQNASDDKKPTITLMVPWKKEGTDTDWKPCYYQIPVNIESKNNSLADCFERNMYYKINLHVGILGDFDPNNPTVIPASYYTVDWNNQPVDVDIKNYKYLVVDKNDVTVYNENEVRIGYASSDPISAEIIYIRRPNYSNAKVDTTRFYGTLTNQTGATSVSHNSMLRACTVSVKDNEIVLNHNLVNKSSDDDVNYDYVPYYIWIKVTMTVQVNGINKTFTEWIRYEQYPAIYVKAHLNSDYTQNKTNDDWISSDNDHKGYVFVNGYQGNSYQGDSWPNAYVNNTYQQFLGSANGMSENAGNKNPNMYVINVSALPQGSSYIIGDPRVKSIDENLRDMKFTGGNRKGNSIWINAKQNNGTTNRRLTYPYPTDASTISETGNSEDDPSIYTTGYMIAPKIRVASSYSVLTTAFVTDKEIARRRCASYQEDGYPAGRWRLPTYAEGEFMVKLSSEGKIPILFSKDSYYWCAHGYFDPATGNNNNGDVKYYNSSTRNGGASVRCVYDEWYWGSDPIADKTKFTWGDAERN